MKTQMGTVTWGLRRELYGSEEQDHRHSGRQHHRRHHDSPHHHEEAEMRDRPADVRHRGTDWAARANRDTGSRPRRSQSNSRGRQEDLKVQPH